MNDSRTRDRRSSVWLVVNWTETGVQNEAGHVLRPNYSVHSDGKEADSAARVRNALVAEIKGDVVGVWDYKYLDDKGEPIEGHASPMYQSSGRACGAAGSARSL